MRAEGREEERLSASVGVGGPAHKQKEHRSQSQTDWVRVLAPQPWGLGQVTEPFKPTYPFLYGSPYCLCFLLGSGCP